MNRTEHQPTADSQPFIRARRIELEPVLFALSMLAMVVTVSAWHSSNKVEQTVVAGASSQVVGVKPSR